MKVVLLRNVVLICTDCVINKVLNKIFVLSNASIALDDCIGIKNSNCIFVQLELFKELCFAVVFALLLLKGVK